MDQIISIIVSAIAGILLAVLTWRFQMKMEFSKILESYVSDKKYKAYYNAIDLFYQIMSASKTNNKEPVTVKHMIKVKQDLFMYGSDESFKAFTKYLCLSTESNQKESFDAFLNFMIIIRKELSGTKSSITKKDILLNIMQSKSELEKFYDAISL